MQKYLAWFLLFPSPSFEDFLGVFVFSFMDQIIFFFQMVKKYDNTDVEIIIFNQVGSKVVTVKVHCET